MRIEDMHGTNLLTCLLVHGGTYVTERTFPKLFAQPVSMHLVLTWGRRVRAPLTRTLAMRIVFRLQDPDVRLQMHLGCIAFRSKRRYFVEKKKREDLKKSLTYFWRLHSYNLF